MKQSKENCLLLNKHFLLYDNFYESKELDYVKKNFCGIVFNINDFNIDKCPSNILIYLCGNTEQYINLFKDYDTHITFVVKQLSINYDNVMKFRLIDLGEVPINIYNVGLYFRDFLDPNKDYYKELLQNHVFQKLKHSNKPGIAFRKGLYLSNVVEKDNKLIFDIFKMFYES